MADQKLTQLTEVTSIDGEDLIYTVLDPNGTPLSRGISKENLTADIITSPVQTNPVENDYSNIAAMLADQGNQTLSFFQYVVDASADPNVASGEAYYEKLATSTTTLATDYRLLSDTEVQVITDSNGYRVFRISDVQDDSTPLTSVAGGRIGFEYDTGGGLVTGILFNKRYTDAILEFYQQNVNFKFYNRTTRKYHYGSIATADWSTVNTDYYHAAVTGITASELTVNDRVEFFIDIQDAGGSPTGLEAINEGNGIGFVLIGRDAANYGNIGLEAVDLSFSNSASSVHGATGDYSFATGFLTEASGIYSFAAGVANKSVGSNSSSFGSVTEASGNNSFAAGRYAKARSFSEIAIGTYTTEYTANNLTSHDNGDRIFVVGVGTSTGVNESDAFTILKSGDVAVGINNFESNTSGDKLQVDGNILANGYKIPSGTSDDVLLGDGSTTSLAGIGGSSVSNDTTTAYELVIDDANNIVTMNNASSNTLTIPANSSVAFEIGTQITLINKGAGVTTIAITTDTLNQNVGGLTLSQYDKRTLTKITSTSWILGY